MRIGLIIILFFMSLFFDGIIFPAFFNFTESFLTIIFVVAMLLFCGTNVRGLALGMVFSGLAEFYWGLKLGVLVLPLLVSAGIFFLLDSFFDIKSGILIILSGVIVFVAFWESSILISKIL